MVFAEWVRNTGFVLSPSLYWCTSSIRKPFKCAVLFINLYCIDSSNSTIFTYSTADQDTVSASRHEYRDEVERHCAVHKSLFKLGRLQMSMSYDKGAVRKLYAATSFSLAQEAASTLVLAAPSN